MQISCVLRFLTLLVQNRTFISPHLRWECESSNLEKDRGHKQEAGYDCASCIFHIIIMSEEECDVKSIIFSLRISESKVFGV